MESLLIKQTLPNGSTRTWKMRSSETQKTFGSSRLADLSSVSPSLKGIQGVFEYKADKWLFINMDSQLAATDKSPEVLIEADTRIVFGDSTISFEINKKDYSLLALLDKLDEQPLQGDEKPFQLWLVKKNGSIIETKITSVKEKFIPSTTPKRVVVSPIGGREWSRTEFEGMEIVHRTVHLTPAQKIPGLDKSQMMDAENRKAFFFVCGVIGLISLLAFIAPKSDPPEQVAKEYVSQNIDLTQFQDQKKPEKKKKEKDNTAKQQTSAQGEQNQAAGKAGNSLRSITGGRISQILGKISVTAARSNHVVLAKGIAANRGGGRALAGVGTVERSGRDWQQEGLGGSLRVATLGKGGGLSGGAFGGLKGSGVGKGDVGLLEDESEVEGGLDKELIAQYIKSKLGQIRYCYERQLSATPDLYGKVEIRFEIAKTGQVDKQKINETSLKNNSVEGCILSKVSSWKFPEPKNGTRVVVKYPFMFKSTN